MIAVIKIVPNQVRVDITITIQRNTQLRNVFHNEGCRNVEFF